MSITYKLTATETCEERDKIIRTREFKTCTGLNPKPGPGPGPAQDQELRPVSGPGPPEKAKARPVQASVLKYIKFVKSYKFHKMVKLELKKYTFS